MIAGGFGWDRMRASKPKNVAKTVPKPVIAPRSEPVAEGGLLQITKEGVLGWARYPGRPDMAVKVVLSIGGKPVASALADRFDLPAVRAELGEGVAGFVAALTALPDVPMPYEIELRSAQGTVLGWPLVVREVADILPAVVAPPPDYEGQVDFLREGKLYGWVWNRATPEEAVVVSLLDGTEVLAHCTANLHRRDLQEAGKRRGFCAFEFELPVSLLDMRVHSLRVEVRDNRGRGGRLAHSPVTFGPSYLSPLIDEVLALRNEVKRLAALVGGAAPGSLPLLRTNDMVQQALAIDLTKKS